MATTSRAGTSSRSRLLSTSSDTSVTQRRSSTSPRPSCARPSHGVTSRPARRADTRPFCAYHAAPCPTLPHVRRLPHGRSARWRSGPCATPRSPPRWTARGSCSPLATGRACTPCCRPSLPSRTTTRRWRRTCGACTTRPMTARGPQRCSSRCRPTYRPTEWLHDPRRSSQDRGAAPAQPRAEASGRGSAAHQLPRHLAASASRELAWQSRPLHGRSQGHAGAGAGSRRRHGARGFDTGGTGCGQAQRGAARTARCIASGVRA
mmetsp:Transcript_70646/g.140024  ORF Transcript_70646/g.140024 Transcript_70646/m.140024 type:complete len:263 (+) Transcript_70646:602-1390(+)